MQLLKRRARNLTLTMLSAILAYFIFDIVELSLAVQQYYSGWLMIILISVLFAYFAKKRLSILPLGSNSNWVQWHYYFGLFLLATFLIHTELSIPQGYVDLAMATAFMVVIVTGVIGVMLNRVLARRLAYLGGEIIYEQIEAQVHQLKQEVEALILE